MSSEMVVIRLPTGETEFRLGATDDLKVGDRVKRGEEECEVVDVHRNEHGHSVVTLGLIGEKVRPARAASLGSQLRAASDPV